MEQDKIEFAHMRNMKITFLEVDKECSGLVSKIELLKKIKKYGMTFPTDSFLALLKFLQVKEGDESDEAILSYGKLRAIFEAY